MTALTVFLTSTNDTLLTTARTLVSAAPGSVTTVSSGQFAKNGTGWTELFSQGANATLAGTEPAASGHGFLFNVTTLEGQRIAAGTWTASVLLGAVATGFTVTPVMRVFKRDSSGVYTQFTNSGAAQDLTASSQALTTSQVAATFSQALDSMDFAAGDKLYIDVLLNITTGSASNTAASRVIKLSENGGASEQAVTPGYSLIPVSAAGSLAISGTATAAAPAAASGLLDITGTGAATAPVTLANSFEGGTSGTTITTANSGGTSGNAFDTVSVGSGATNAFDSTHAAHGTLAATIATGATATTSYLAWSASIGSAATYWFRIYAYFTANPAAAIRLAGIIQATTVCAAVVLNTDGTIKVNNTAGTAIFTTASSVPLNQWFRVEGFVTGDGSAGQAELKLFDSADSGTATETQTSSAAQNTFGAPNTIRVGVGSSVANVTAFWLDDLGVSTAGYLGPAAPPAATAAGSLSLSGTAAGGAPATVTGSIALTGTGPSGAAVSASGALALAGTAAASGPGTTAAGALALAGTAAAAAPVTATGSLTFAGTATAAAPAAASGALDITGTGAATAPVTLANSFEGGTSGTTVGTANSGGTSGSAFDQVQIGTGAVFRFDSTQAAHGSLGATVSVGATATQSRVYWTTSMGSQAQAWFRMYLYFTANPAATINLFRAEQGTTLCAGMRILASGHLTMIDSASATLVTSAAVVPLNQWFRVEGYVIGDASNGGAELQLFQSADAATTTDIQTAAAGHATTGLMDHYSYGITTGNLTNTVAFWLDDLGLSASGYLGPAAGGGAATASGALSLAGTAAAGAAGTASGALSLAGTAAAAGPGTTAAGSLALAGTSAAKAAATASGGLGLAGTAAAAAPAAAAGAVALAGTAAPAAQALSPAGTAALTGGATARAPANASGALALSGTAPAKAPAAAAGSLALAGTAAAAGPGTTAAGSLALAGTAAARAAISTYDSIILNDGPVVYYPGTTGTDATGHGHTLTAFNSPAPATLPNGDSAYAFNGTTQYCETPDADDLSVLVTATGGTGIGTFEAWIRPDVLTFPHEESDGYVHWAGKGTSGQHEFAHRMYGADNTAVPYRENRISGYAFNLSGSLGNGAYWETPGGETAGAWLHYVLVINFANTSPAWPSGYVTIYRNSVNTNTQTLAGITPGNGTAPLRLGTRDFASHFQGAIGKYAVYNYELTAGQVSTHYAAMAAVPATGAITLAGTAAARAPASAAGSLSLAGAAVTAAGPVTGSLALAGTAAGAAQAGAAGSLALAGTAAWEASPFLAYTAGSYFKSPAASQPVSTSLTSSFRTFMATFAGQAGTAYPNLNGIGSNQFGTPYAMGSAGDPVWVLTGTMNAAANILQTQGFHAPDWLGSVLTGTTDSPFCVIDTANGYTVFGTQASVTGTHTINVGSAGITYHASNGLDSRNPQSDDSRNWTSRGRISDAMVIRRDLIDYAIANNTDLGHVLHLFMVETDSTAGFQSPMVGSEAGKAGWGAEGQRLAIDASIDLTTRGLSPAGLVIARTLQVHGCYIGDNAGGASALKAEQETATHSVWSGVLTQSSLSGITWNDFVALIPAGANAAGSLALAGTAAGTAPAAAASGALALSGTAPAKAPAAAAGVLALAGTAAARAPASAAGSLALAGTAATQAPPGAGVITLSGSAAARAPAAGGGALSLAGTGAAKAAATAAGSVVFAGTAAAFGPGANASGSLALAGTAAGAAQAGAAGSIALAGTAAAGGQGTAAGTLALAGTAAAAVTAPAPAGTLSLAGAAVTAAPVLAAGSIALAGTGALAGGGPAPGVLALAGTAAAGAAAAPAGSLDIAATGAAGAGAAAAGSLGIAGTAALAAAATAAGMITLAGIAEFTPPFTIGRLTAPASSSSIITSSTAPAGAITASTMATGALTAAAV